MCVCAHVYVCICICILHIHRQVSGVMLSQWNQLVSFQHVVFKNSVAWVLMFLFSSGLLPTHLCVEL